MMKTFVFAFALTLLVTQASAYTCEDVRRFVAENGLAQARAKARAAGMTDAQERQAAACLGIRIGPHGQVIGRHGGVYRASRCGWRQRQASLLVTTARRHAGDGVMVVFNDPVEPGATPVPNSAKAQV
jgi:hypothetical protein